MMQRIHYSCKYYLKLYKYFFLILKSNGQRNHALRWLKSMKTDYFFDKPCPWFVFDAIDFLKDKLFEGIRIFEYGSGGSTLFWLLYNPVLVVSVEHDPEWYRLMISKLGTPPHVDLRLVLPEICEYSNVARDPADPNCYISSDKSLSGYTFRKYVAQIDSFKNFYFDVVVIDGRARPSCIKHSVNKVRRGGILILDNADRTYYTSKTKEYLSCFQCHIFFGVGPKNDIPWQTNIYIKPK